ncbi:MAG: hypothetical protein ACTSXF_12135 [Promethearchaeota archaeon]
MSQSIFEQIKASLEEVMSGRRYLLSVIEKLRKEMPNVQPTLDKVNETMESMQNLVALNDKVQKNLEVLQSGLGNINNMAVALENLKKSVEGIENSYLQNDLVLEAINKKLDKQEKAIAALGEMMGTLGELMGQILAKMK